MNMQEFEEDLLRALDTVDAWETHLINKTEGFCLRHKATGITLHRPHIGYATYGYRVLNPERELIAQLVSIKPKVERVFDFLRLQRGEAQAERARSWVKSFRGFQE